MGELQLIRPDWEVSSRVVAFVTSRRGGVSEKPFASLNLGQHVGDDPARVNRNRELVQAAFEEVSAWQWLDQVHGKSVHEVSEVTGELQGDGLVTRQNKLACCVMTADCLPVFLASSAGDEVAIAHGGWRGLAAGIVQATVDSMRSTPADLCAFLGPAIGPDHFEVGPEVREAFLRTDGSPAMTSQFRPAGDRYFADLFGIARLQLAAAGVSRVSGGDHCTFGDADNFYSYRRDGQTGRMLNAIYIR